MICLCLPHSLPASGDLPECDPGTGNTLTGGSAHFIVNVNSTCKATVPDVNVRGDWTASPGPGFVFNGPLVQVPASGTVIQLSGCPNGTLQLIIIAVFFSDNGTPTNPADDIICQLRALDEVTINDPTPPTFTCPAARNIDVDAMCSASESMVKDLITAAHVSDNCTSKPALLASLTIVSGYPFPSPGVACPPATKAYPVMYQIHDACGNTKQCVTVITLRGMTPPELTCPADVTVNLNGSCSYTIPRSNSFVYKDNCVSDPLTATFTWRIIDPPAYVGNIPAAGRTINRTNMCPSGTPVTVRICARDCRGNGNLYTSSNTVGPNCCTYVITLKDNTLPSFNSACGGATDLIVDPGTCTAVMPNLAGTLSISKNCGSGQVSIYQIPAPGSTLNDGIADPLGLASGPGASHSCHISDQDDPIVACGQSFYYLKSVMVSFVIADCEGNCIKKLNCKVVLLIDDNPGGVIQGKPQNHLAGILWTDSPNDFKTGGNADSFVANNKLMQNYPNPVIASTRVEFLLAKEGPVQFTVMDVAGRMIYNRHLFGVVGQNSVELSRSDLGQASGSLLYQLRGQGFVLNKSMVVK